MARKTRGFSFRKTFKRRAQTDNTEFLYSGFALRVCVCVCLSFSPLLIVLIHCLNFDFISAVGYPDVE